MHHDCRLQSQCLRDTSWLRFQSVTCVTYQCCLYKSVTSNSLLLEALCSMLGENNGESDCKETHPTRLDRTRSFKIIESSLEMISTFILTTCCLELVIKQVKRKQKLISVNQQAATLSRDVLLTRFCVTLNKLSIWSGAGLLFDGDLERDTIKCILSR